MGKDFENNENTGDPNNFGLPGDYFQRSASNIMNKIEWLEEHKQFPLLSDLKKDTGFIVPELFFEKSEARLELICFPHLLGRKKESGFVVHENYFDENEKTELSKVLIDDNNDLLAFPLLAAIPRKNSFIVADGYFEKSEQKIVSSIKKPAKVIRLFGAKTWYSAAAALVAITVGLWIYNYYFAPVTNGDCGTLACVEKTDLVKTKNLENLDEDQLYEIVNSKKLEEKLEEKDGKKENKNADTSLKNISTDELLDEI